MQGVSAIRVGLQRAQRRCERARRAAQVTHRQSHLGLSHDAASPRQFLMAAKPPAGSSQQLSSSRVVAKLRHSNAAQGQGRRIVAQGHTLERAKRVTGGESSCRGGDQRIHEGEGNLRCAGGDFGLMISHRHEQADLDPCDARHLCGRARR